MKDEVIIPFTAQEYGTVFLLLLDFTNRIIESDDGTGPIDPAWPLVMKFWLDMHGALLKPRPRDNEKLKGSVPAVAKGQAN